MILPNFREDTTGEWSLSQQGGTQNNKVLFIPFDKRGVNDISSLINGKRIPKTFII